MSSDPCRTSETDRQEAFYVLSATAIVIAWLLFIGGCAARPIAHAPSALQAEPGPAAPLMVHETPNALSHHPASPPTVVFVTGLGAHARGSCDVNAAIRQSQREVRCDIKRLKSDIRRYSSGGSCASRARR